MRFRPGLTLLTVASLLLSVTAPLAAEAPTAEPDDIETYIVALEDAPLASYRGDIDGLPATNPDSVGATTLDSDSAASRAYLTYLEGVQESLIASATAALGRSPQVVHRYRFAYNGLAMRLNPAEAEAVRGLPGVTDVQAPIERQILTDAGPAWIGAPALWDGSGGPDGAASQGEGVVVGVIDTGVNHDHPSFAATGGDGFTHTNPRDQFYGLCDPVTGLPFSTTS